MNGKDQKLNNEPSAKINFVYNSVYQIVAILIPLVTTPYLSRKLGANGLGEYAMELAVASYFIMFIKLGLNNYGGRQIAYSRGNKVVTSREFWEMYAFQIVMMTICGAAYVVYCFFISGHKTISLILIIYVISAGIDITWFFWGLEEFKLTVRRDFIVKILSTICIFVFVNNETDTWKYTLLLSIAYFLSQALLWPSLKKHIDFVRPSKKGIIKHIKPNLVLFVPTIAISLYKTMDKIMLGAMSNTVEVGFYQSSENVIQIPMSLILSLGTVMQPRMANLISKKTDEKSIEKIFAISISLVMFLSTSIGFGIMTVSREFVPMFYGDGFEKCILLFQILLPSCIFLAFANVIRTQYLIPRKKDKEYIISLFSGAAVNLLFNSILIPIYQSAGASIGTFLAEMTVCLVQATLVRKELNSAKYFIQSIPFTISGMLMYIIWKPINIALFNNQVISLFTKVVASGITYLSLLLLLILIWNRCFKMEIEYLNIFKSIKTKRRS